MATDDEEASTSSQPPHARRQRRLEKKQKVFLSHSGKDKAFVSHLDHRLRSVHHYPFFDVREDSLPVGDEFAHIIFRASKQCRLAIVVVSDDFFKSKWPMLELAAFVEAKNGVNPEMKILPLFYRLTVAEFKEPERQRDWFEKWEKLKESDERLDISSWEKALRVLGGHNGVVYCGIQQTEDEYIENIVQSVFRLVHPDALYDDSHVKGGTHLREGRRLYKERVGSHKVFLAIDNVWDDRKSLEEAAGYLVHELHPESKVLVTARCKETLRSLGIPEGCCFEMPDLREEDAMGLFLHYACPSPSPIDLANPEHLEVVEKCVSYAWHSKGGDTKLSPTYHLKFHPWALKVLGLYMRTLTPFPSKWIEKLNNPKILGSKVKDVNLVLRTSFDMLPEDDHRAMFLDVAIYAPNAYYDGYKAPTMEEVCEWLSMVYAQEIEVVKDKLEVLSARGLLNQWDDLTDSISMHDLYLEFAEAEVKRDDNHRGRAHLYYTNENNIPQCLKRILKGTTTFSFERMKFNNVCNLDSFKQAKLDKCANVEVLKVDHCDALQSLDINGLEELRSLELIECENLEHLQGLETRDKLVWMRWTPCRAKVVDYKLLTSLRVLQLTKVSHTTIIDLRNCHNLQELAIQNSHGLEDFPLFPDSKSMRKICFAYCTGLRHRGPELLNLEGWINVEFLDLSYCWSATNELESCPIMKNLKHFDVSYCNNLNVLPDLTLSKNLITLNVVKCIELLKTYASSSQFLDSMPTDLHPGLNTSRVSLHYQAVASRIVGKFGVSTQVSSLQLKD